MEKTLIILKPDAIRKNLVGEVLQRLEADGLEIIDAKMTTLTEARAAAFYAEHKGKEFYERLMEFMTSGSIFLCVVGGKNAIRRARLLMGDTDPAEAAPGTIRAEFGGGMPDNIIHGSDSIESAKREISFFFSECEMINE